MLIGARDKVDGCAGLFWADDIDDVETDHRGRWFIQLGGAECWARGVQAEFACRDIPPGESRVIDLEKSVIVHVAPKKTAMEELVEACEMLSEEAEWLASEQKYLIRSEIAAQIESALARVRQEGGV